MLQETNRIAGHQVAKADRGEMPPILVPFLHMIAKQARAILGIKLAAIDIEVGQDQLLLALAPNEPLAVSRLASVLSVRPSTVSKTVDRLEKKSFVKRSSGGGDARKTYVSVTATGAAMQECVRSVHAEMERELRRALGDATGTTIAVLGNLEQVLTARLGRLR